MASQIDWTLERIQKHIEEVSLGEKLVQIDTPKEPVFILFKYPPKKIIRLADMEQSRITFKATKDNFLTEEDMLKLMREKKIWTDEDDERIISLTETIADWQKKLKNPDIGEGSKKSFKNILEKLESELWSVEIKKERMLIHTVDRKARQSKYDYLAWACSLDPLTSHKTWDNYLTYCQELETDFKTQILNEFIRFLAGHTTAEIRFLARSNLWRISYISAQKANMPLFPESIVEMTPDQLNLVWWSSYYQSIYEMMPDDQPEDRIIEDDEELDKYMDGLHKERAKERAAKRAEKKYGPSTAMKMKEVLVTRSHPDYMHLEYDKPPEFQKDSDVTLKDDPESEGARRKKGKKLAKSIAKSKRFTPNERGEN